MNQGPAAPRSNWSKAEMISILVPFAVLAPFFLYDKPFTSRWWRERYAHAEERKENLTEENPQKKQL